MLKRGSVIYKEGDEANDVYLILSGEVEMKKNIVVLHKSDS